MGKPAGAGVVSSVRELPQVDQAPNISPGSLTGRGLFQIRGRRPDPGFGRTSTRLLRGGILVGYSGARWTPALAGLDEH